MSFKTYSILWIVLFCFGFPSGVFGQYILKETIGGKTYAVIYADSLAGSAQWGLGVKMMRNGTTIRHQVAKGNGGNLSVNDRIPFRFIVADQDVGNNGDWMTAQGVNSGDQDEKSDFSGTGVSTGCRQYGAIGQPGEGRQWRVPTQRELQLIWMFRQPIGLISGNPMEESGKTKRYWASTEKGATEAWFFEFAPGKPYCDTQAKTKSDGTVVRCVSDY